MSETKPEYKIEERPATIFRVIHDKDNPYVMINRTPIDNVSLSFKAKGILTYLLSRPDGWEVNLVDLANRSTDGLASVQAGVKELQKAGHLHHTTIVDKETGKFASHLWEVYETPQVGVDNQNAKNQNVDKPQSGKSHASIKYLSSEGANQESTTTKEITKKVFTAYENEIGPITPHVRDVIGDYLDDLKVSPEWMIDSFHIAAEHNKRSWAYCAAILKRWAVEGKTALPPKPTPSGPKYPGKMKGDNTEFFKDLEIAAKKDNPWQPEKRLLVSSDT